MWKSIAGVTMPEVTRQGSSRNKNRETQKVVAGSLGPREGWRDVFLQDSRHQLLQTRVLWEPSWDPYKLDIRNKLEVRSQGNVPGQERLSRDQDGLLPAVGRVRNCTQ